jgi:hypothetical protein
MAQLTGIRNRTAFPLTLLDCTVGLLTESEIQGTLELE